MYGLPQLRHLNASNSFAQKQREEEAKARAEQQANSVEFDDETGHGISEDETIVSDQAS